MRKDYRQNYRMGTNPFARKSNLQKIAETFGPKKKVKKNKKPTKRMFANVGGGADTGKMGEVKSKLATAMDKLKKLKAMGKKVKKDEVKIDNFGLREEKAKGGSAKKKKKFPDMSGDGKVTMKDVLMARGVIPKKKKTKKKVI
jgi:hypothetical protein